MTTIKSTIVGLAAGALLLAGCSGTPSDDPTVEPTSPDATGAPSATAQPTVGNQDDALCAAAEASRADAAELQSTTQELTDLMKDPSFMGSGDASKLNAWGEKMIALSESSLAFYDLGVTETQGEPVNSDFAALSAFVNEYTMGLATVAANASSPSGFFEDVSDTFTDPEIREIASKAPAAAQSVATYIGERCGLTG